MSMAGLRYCPSSTGNEERCLRAWWRSIPLSLLRVELCKKKMEQKAKEKAKDSKSPTVSPVNGGRSRRKRLDQGVPKLLLRNLLKPRLKSKSLVVLPHPLVEQTMTCWMFPPMWSWSERSWKG